MIPLFWPMVAVTGFAGYKIWEDTSKPSPVTNQCNVPGACSNTPDTDLMDYAGLAFIAAAVTAAYLYSKK